MENRKSVTKYLLGIVACTLFLPTPAIAYYASTHKLLTEQVLAEYEALRGDTFTHSEAQHIVQGAIDEDELGTDYMKIGGYEVARRPLNHFYNPLNGSGLNARVRVPWGWDPKVTGMATTIWATDTVTQAEFGLESDRNGNDKLFAGDADFTWQRAVYDYAHGTQTQQERALQALGHILHLVEDMTVPAHVRNDPHPAFFEEEVSPYEMYTKGKAPQYEKLDAISQHSSLRNIMHELALFTNRYFLSKHTIFEEFALPSRESVQLVRAINDGEGNYFGVSNYGELVRVKQERNRYVPGAPASEEYYLTDQKNVILSNYYNILSQKAVEYGVATIDLFFRDVARERKTLALKHMNVSEYDILSVAGAIKNFGKTKRLFGSSLAASDVYALNDAEWEGMRKTAGLYNMGFPDQPEGVSVLEGAFNTSNDEREVFPISPPKPPVKKVEGYEAVGEERTIIRGEQSVPGNQARQSEGETEQLASALSALEALLGLFLQEHMSKEGCDTSLFKMANCINPFDPGGFAYGAGGAYTSTAESSGPSGPGPGGPAPPAWEF